MKKLKKKATIKTSTSSIKKQNVNKGDKKSDNVIASLIGCLFKGVLGGIGGS